MSLITKIEFINKTDKDSILKHSNIDMHDHLTDQADWGSEYWDFEPEFLQTYSQIINKVINSSSKGITFQALWAGDKQLEVVELSIKELLKTIENNKIKTRAKYIARKIA